MKAVAACISIASTSDKVKEQWPSERYAERREVIANPPFKSSQDFRALLSTFPVGLLQDFDDVVIWIAEQGGDLAEVEFRMAPLVEGANLQLPDSCLSLITLACAAALAYRPSLQTWSRVKEIKSNSALISHRLTEAMMVYVELHSFACDAYPKLAKEALSAFECLKLESSFSRVNQERGGALAHWNEQSEKLEEIWRGLRGWQGFMNYEEELPLFQVFYKLDPDEFVGALSNSSNPYLVSALLFVAGIGAFSPRFSEWKRIVAAAPVAFENDGAWNGSVLMPLLLVEARDQLMQVRQSLRNPASTPGELDEAEKEIRCTAELIVTSLAARKDALAIVVRWVPWLMRKVLGQTAKEVADVKSPAFADHVLIAAIGRTLVANALPQESPENASAWEVWCYRCALASFAYNGLIRAPDWDRFKDEWDISPEDWNGNKGRLLREHASLITTMETEIPGMAANLLAYPIAQSSSATETWFDLWNGAIALREIVEFGDADAVEDEYMSRSEAGRLLLLLFSIGLAIFDQSAAHCSSDSSPEARSLVSLFKALSFAVCEMREVDSTLNHDRWLSAANHLAIRRMIWDNSHRREDTSGSFQVFNASDTPTITDILADAKSNVVDLVSLLQSLLLNSDASSLKACLESVSIDLSYVVRSVRKLNEYHPRMYPIDEAQLQKLAMC